jgi:redox-sensitive bicupin YhaK (pirin superfamily)
MTISCANWERRNHSDLMYVDVVLDSNARLQVPADHVERALFVISGEIEVTGQAGTFGESQLVVLKVPRSSCAPMAAHI